MKKFTSRTQRICLQAALIFAVAIALILSSELAFSGQRMQAIAKPLTPEAEFYEVARPDRPPTTDTEKEAYHPVDETGDKQKLDTSIAPSTERFIESVEKNGGEVVTPARKAVEKAANGGRSDRVN